jgi:diaminohydroxyphosphoribosylaminopyrimidine deaminase/5-amino-6-(5-phosphoribosylamino)uracil reductase
MAGEQASAATLYVTLEPCAHDSPRGPSCAGLISQSPLARVVVGCDDPDPRTARQGMEAIRQAGIAIDVIRSVAAEESLAGYMMLRRQGRPHVTLKLATSLDGCIALPSGESRWITGEAARAHSHAMRAKADAILVGGGTLRSDAPQLDVRLPGLEERSPERWVLTRGEAPPGWRALPSPAAIADMGEAQYLFAEGGAETAAAFLAAGLVDRLLLYRAPIVIGCGRASVGDIGLASLEDAHGQWRREDRRQLGSDTLEVYSRC